MRSRRSATALRRFATAAARSWPTGRHKAHCAFYPMSPAVQETFRAALEAFDTSKGTIRFTPTAMIPAAVVTGIVQARMAEIDASG